MPHEIRIPRLGWSMEEGTFVRWLLPDGATVAVGAPLYELEGEKATQEIESVDAGRLHILADGPQAGAIVAVGALIGHLVVDGESALLETAMPGNLTSPAMASSATKPSVARASNPKPIEVNEDVQTNGTADGHRPVASPRARRVAAELGIDWTTLSGSGAEGRVREADVRAVAKEPNSASSSTGRSTQQVSVERIPITAHRRVITERLNISRQRTIPVTLTQTVDATNLIGLRSQFKSTGTGITPSYTDIVACLVTAVLGQHRRLAARWDEGHAALLVPDEVPLLRDGLPIGIAVETPEGLLVPVIPSVRPSGLMDVARRTKTIVEKARAGKLTAAEMQGGVFTISNLGGFGIEAFTPVINYPEVAILGLGAIRREAVCLEDDQIVPRDRMVLSLTFDHAAMDGAPAAAFLRDLALAIEQPAPRLLQS